MDCGNYREISLLSRRLNRILSSTLFSMLISHVNKITGQHQCGFRRNTLTTAKIFCIRRTPQKNWEYNGTVHQLFILRRPVTVMREVSYKVLNEVVMKLVKTNYNMLERHLQ